MCMLWAYCFINKQHSIAATTASSLNQGVNQYHRVKTASRVVEQDSTVKVLHTYAGDKHPTKESWLHYYIRKGQTARAINHIKSDNDPDKLIHIGVRGIIDVGGYKYR